MCHPQLSQLSRYRWRVPLPACCVLQTIFGLLYANGVFIALIDQPEFTLAIGVLGFFTAVGITAFGIIMNNFIPPHHYQSAPLYTALLGSFGLASQLLIAYALAIRSTSLLFFAAALVGTGSGCVYVASVDVLQAWVPESPGMVTGLGMLCGGAGSLLGIYIFRVLAHALHGPIPAIALVGLLSGATACAASLFVSRPPRDWQPHPYLPLASEHTVNSIDETAKLIPCPASYAVYPALTVRDILTDSAFYLLLIAFAASVGPGFGFILGFQRMCTDMFATDVDTANNLFFFVTLTGVLGRFLSGLAVDALENHSENPTGLQGARSTNFILLVSQTFALLSIPYFIRQQQIYMFTLATSVVYIAFSGGAVVAACLVRGIFMPNNASLSFSLVAVSIGCGDMFFSWVVAKSGEYSALQRELHDVAPQFHHNDYNLFLFYAILWSILGLIATVCIKTSEKVTADEKDIVLPFADTLLSN